MEKKQKTIFIPVTRGFIVRNILRSGVLDEIKKAGHKTVIFFPPGKNEEAEALIKEFQGERVIVEFFPKEQRFGRIKNGLYLWFKKTAPYLVYSKSTWAYSQIGNSQNLQRASYWMYLEKYTFGVLSKIRFLKPLARFVENHFFYAPFYKEFFEKYKPDLIFSTSIVSKEDIQFMKEARKRRIPSVSMPKGWDNIAKMLFRVVPDRLVFQNKIMKADAVRLQAVSEDIISVCGFPQFDWYLRPEILMPREELFKKLGLDPARRLIFFGSEGIWAPDDDKVAERIAKLVSTDAFVKPSSVLVRPHFSDLAARRFNRLIGIPNVKVDDNYTQSDYFNDNWNPSDKETKLFVNCLYHSDVMVTIASTLVLDAACYDKPSVGIAYDVLHHPKTGIDVSKGLYETDHFEAVIKTGALDVVHNEKELITAINNALLKPEAKHKEREVLIETLCHKADGQSSERIAEVLFMELEKNK